MFILLSVLTGFMALVCLGSSIADWKKDPRIVESMERMNVPAGVQPLLPVFKMAGAAGIVLGLWVNPLGIAAGIGLVLYFVGAVFFHTRAKDHVKDTGPAGLMLIICVLIAVLQLGR
jgi:type IV secretory pathway TrbD component